MYSGIKTSLHWNQKGLDLENLEKTVLDQILLCIISSTYIFVCIQEKGHPSSHTSKVKEVDCVIAQLHHFSFPRFNGVQV